MANLPVACHALPLTDAKLTEYKLTIEELPAGPVKDAMQTCYDCVAAWWELEESKRPASQTYRPFSDKEIAVIPLEDEQVQLLWDTTPWKHELLAIQSLFEALPNGLGAEVPASQESPGSTPVIDLAAWNLRNAAFDLVWHAMEITLDREPLTHDKLIPYSS